MGLRIVQVDAFSSKPFAGNPAAVCVLAHAADKKWMQAVAREMNLSETAFLFRAGDVLHPLLVGAVGQHAHRGGVTGERLRAEGVDLHDAQSHAA